MKALELGEHVLGLLLDAVELALNPSPSRILRFLLEDQSPAEVRQHLRRMRRARWLERTTPARSRQIQLSAHGRLTAWGGVDGPARWERPWDGRWRLLLFDLPAQRHALRLRLWRWLRQHRFGFLQNSVWLTPDPIPASGVPLRGLRLPAESLTVIEGRPAAKDADPDLVRGAWDFAKVNGLYQHAMELAAAGRRLLRDGVPSPTLVRGWLAAEWEAWWLAVAADPFLPEALLPPDYLGRRASEARREVLALVGQAITAL